MNLFKLINKISKQTYFVIMIFSFLMVHQFISVAVQSKRYYPSYNNTPEITIVIIFLIIGLFATQQFIWKKKVEEEIKISKTKSKSLKERWKDFWSDV